MAFQATRQALRLAQLRAPAGARRMSDAAAPAGHFNKLAHEAEHAAGTSFFIFFSPFLCVL